MLIFTYGRQCKPESTGDEHIHHLWQLQGGYKEVTSCGRRSLPEDTRERPQAQRRQSMVLSPKICPTLCQLCHCSQQVRNFFCHVAEPRVCESIFWKTCSDHFGHHMKITTLPPHPVNPILTAFGIQSCGPERSLDSNILKMLQLTDLVCVLSETCVTAGTEAHVAK